MLDIQVDYLIQYRADVNVQFPPMNITPITAATLPGNGFRHEDFQDKGLKLRVYSEAPHRKPNRGNEAVARIPEEHLSSILFGDTMVPNIE